MPGAPVDFALRTDPGRSPDKQVNEDACAEKATRFGHLVVVCDGMGGHAGGREAAELALRTILEAFDRADAGAVPRNVLTRAIADANARVFRMTSPDEGESGKGGRPGSTVVAALVTPYGTEIAHVGDSRAYLAHGAQIYLLTKDHSAVQRLVDEGILSAAEAARHPEANKILRALGIASEVVVDVRAEPVPHVPGDVFVLCSDGLSDLVAMEDILRIAGAAPPADAAAKLVELANARGGYDNITVAIVRTNESATRAREPIATTVDGSPPHGMQRRVQTEAMPAASTRAVVPTVLQSPAQPFVPGRSPTPTTQTESPARRTFALVALIVAVFALGIVVHALYTHVEERRGAHRVVPNVSAEPLPSGVPHVDLTPLTAAPADATPTPDAEADGGDVPLAPLVPIAPVGGRRRPRWHD